MATMGEGAAMTGSGVKNLKPRICCKTKWSRSFHHTRTRARSVTWSTTLDPIHFSLRTLPRQIPLSVHACQLVLLGDSYKLVYFLSMRVFAATSCCLRITFPIFEYTCRWLAQRMPSFSQNIAGDDLHLNTPFSAFVCEMFQ